MNHPKVLFIKLLSIGCLTLFIVLVLQVVFVNQPYSIANYSPTSAEEVTSKLGAFEVRDLTGVDYSLIASKPLFTEGREFTEHDVERDGSNTKYLSISNTFKVRLVGVGLMDESALVIVIDNKGKYHRLHVNDKLQGWRVKSINQSKVVFSLSGKDKSFDLEKQRQLLNSNNKAQL